MDSEGDVGDLDLENHAGFGPSNLDRATESVTGIALSIARLECAFSLTI